MDKSDFEFKKVPVNSDAHEAIEKLRTEFDRLIATSKNAIDSQLTLVKASLEHHKSYPGTHTEPYEKFLRENIQKETMLYVVKRKVLKHLQEGTSCLTIYSKLLSMEITAANVPKSRAQQIEVDCINEVFIWFCQTREHRLRSEVLAFTQDINRSLAAIPNPDDKLKFLQEKTNLFPQKNTNISRTIEGFLTLKTQEVFCLSYELYVANSLKARPNIFSKLNYLLMELSLANAFPTTDANRTPRTEYLMRLIRETYKQGIDRFTKRIAGQYFNVRTYENRTKYLYHVYNNIYKSTSLNEKKQYSSTNTEPFKPEKLHLVSKWIAKHEEGIIPYELQQNSSLQRGHEETMTRNISTTGQSFG